jgi:hypothetical protein
MTCHVCKSHIASGSRFCSVCGSTTEPVAVTAGASGGRAEALLAEANLFRLRLQWTEAEKRCVDVMRLDSNNVHAHALLGDIHRDQGKVDDARQWYQMALDLDPHNRALEGKLREVSKAKPPRVTHPKPAPARGVSGGLGTQNLMGLSPTNWFRVIWVFCGLFVVAVTGLVLWTKTHPALVPLVSGTIPGSVTTAPLPVSLQGSGVNPAVGAPMSGTVPNPLSPPAGSLNPGLRPPAVGRAEGNPGIGANAHGIGGDLASREQALVAFFRQPENALADVSIATIRIDPHAQKLSVTLTQRLPSGASDADARVAVAGAALIICRAAFSADAGLQSASAQTSVTSTDGAHQPFFEGDISREVALQPLDSSARPETRFANVWWASPPSAEGTANQPSP